MKKIYILISSVLLLFITSCDLFLEKQLNIDEFIPNEIDDNYQLVDNYEDFILSYYIDNQELTNYIIEVPYLLKDEIINLFIHATKNNKTTVYEKEITLLKGEFVNSLYITTNNGSNNILKDSYTDGKVSINPNDKHSQIDLDMKIKGRGNSTWGYDKKPYRIKFNNRESILGMKHAKDYVLLADFGDKSLMRNYIGHKMSTYTNLEYTIENRYVHVYLNNNYNGLYLLTEQVEVDKNRLSIPTEINEDGFLIELEAEDRIDFDNEFEGIHYVFVSGRYFLIKRPKLEDLDNINASLKANYIRSYINTMYNNLSNPNTYKEYIDEEQFIEYFIIQEITKNVDINFSSVFFYKRPDELLKMGPLWDFDISMGNGYYYPYEPEGFWASNNLFLRRLLNNSKFKQKYINRFVQFLNEFKDQIHYDLVKTFELINEDANQNFLRWQILGEYHWPNTNPMINAKTHEEQFAYLLNWYLNRVDWLLNNIYNV